MQGGGTELAGKRSLAPGGPRPLPTPPALGRLHLQAAARTSANKAEAANNLLTQYEALLVHLRTSGAAVNAVKPEYLLTSEAFDLVLDKRAQVALAESPEAEEELLDAWQVGGAAAWAWSPRGVRKRMRSC
jgi:hypothetical protein